CSQFGSVQFHDWLAGAQPIPFPRENLLHAPGAARSHVHLIDFNGSRDGVASIAARCQEERQRKQRKAANGIGDISSGQHSLASRIASPILQMPAAPVNQSEWPVILANPWRKNLE